MRCFNCGCQMLRGVCTSCGRVARRKSGKNGKIVTCGRCKGRGEIIGFIFNSVCPTCSGKGKVRV